MGMTGFDWTLNLGLQAENDYTLVNM